jgi:hypothetical protein
MIKALTSSGFYAIVLSPSKGSWANRMRLAPNAPPEDPYYCTTGICVIMCAPTLDASLSSFTSAMDQLKTAPSSFKPLRVKNTPPNSTPKVATIPQVKDVWKKATLGDIIPGPLGMAKGLCESGNTFIANLKHNINTLTSMTSATNKFTSAAKGLINELSGTGAYAVMLPPKKQGIISRLTSEVGAPPTGVSYYTVGFCACFYAPDFGQCEEKYQELCSIFDQNMDQYPPGFPNIVHLKLKSWATPPTGCYQKELYVVLTCNEEQATIYYTINGLDPRVDPNRKIYTSPIYVSKTNTIIRHYAVLGQSVERRTRTNLYKIITFLGSIDYSPTLGVLPYVPTYNIGIGDPETCIDAGQGTALDDGGTVLVDAGVAVGVKPESCPVSVVTIIPPDEADTPTTNSYAQIADFDAGNLDPSGAVIPLESNAQIIIATANKIGQYGSDPWGTVSNFPDTTAWWIWNEVMADQTAIANKEIRFEASWKNNTNSPLSLVMIYMTDNSSVFYINGILTDTDTGWYPYDNRFLATYQIPNGYRKVFFIANPGETFNFVWAAKNWGQSAGLIFSLTDSFVLNLPPGILPVIYINSANSVRTQYQILSETESFLSSNTGQHTVADNLIHKVMNNTECNVLISSVYTITEILGDSYELSISADRHSIEGLVTFIANVNLRLKLSNGQTITAIISPTLLPKVEVLNAPVCSNLRFDITKTSVLPIVLTSRHSNNTPIEYFLVNDPNYGTLSGTAPNLVYIPYSGVVVPVTDVFTYKARDTYAVSELATVTINLT